MNGSVKTDKLGKTGSYVAFAIGIYFLTESLKLNVGSLNNPGAGLWPALISSVIVIASFVSLKAKVKTSGEEETGYGGGSLHVVFGAASIALFILLFDSLGITLSGFLLLLFWMRVLGNERWQSSVFAAAGFMLFSIAVFVWGIQVPFPDDLVLSLVWRG